MPNHTDTAARAAEARGFCVTLDACAAVFLNEPDRSVVDDIRRVARTLGVSGFDMPSTSEDSAAGSLRQRFNDRLFVVSSPCYVPLRESCIAGSYADAEGAVHYGGVESSRSDHVRRCFATVGFDYTRLAGNPIAIQTLSCDSLASELAFLAFLKNAEAAAWEREDAAQARHWHDLARRFAREHAATWFGSAHDRLAATGEDLYSRVCGLAAQAAQTIAEEG